MSEPLTMYSMKAVVDALPKVSPWIYYVVKPEYLSRLYLQLQPTPSDVFPNVVIYSKDQHADAWAFSDRKLFQKYLYDEISEDDLKTLAPNARVKEAR